MNNRGAMTMSGLALAVSVVACLLSLGAVLYCRAAVDSNFALAKAINRLADREEK